MTLVIGYGNPGRGDDGLGPELARRIEARALPGVQIISDFQLKVEHAVQVARAARTVFVDAALDAAPPFEFREVAQSPAGDIHSHRVLPDTVVALARQHFAGDGKAFVLAIRGVAFEMFCEELSAVAEHNLASAERFLLEWLDHG